MPIYEYMCDGCDEITEVLQKITEPPLTKCENCGGNLTKKISNSTFILKGTGWYVTDYGSKKNGSGSDDKTKMKRANGNIENGKHGKGGEKVAKGDKVPKDAAKVTDKSKESDKSKENRSESTVKA